MESWRSIVLISGGEHIPDPEISEKCIRASLKGLGLPKKPRNTFFAIFKKAEGQR